MNTGSLQKFAADITEHQTPPGTRDEWGWLGYCDDAAVFAIQRGLPCIDLKVLRAAVPSPTALPKEAAKKAA
jgi:hypothetical protein